MQFCNNFYDKGLIERLKGLLDAEFAHVTYTEAIELLTKAGDRFKYPVSWGCDLQTEHERYLTEEVYKKPVFVTDYPKEIKAFYMRLNDDGKTVAAVDLLVPGIGEIVGGSQREERADYLEKAIAHFGFKRRRLRLVFKPAAVRRRRARRVRAGVRAAGHVYDRHREHPRRPPLPADNRSIY